MNAGTCTLDADDHSYSCDCQRGYRGDRCDENIDECYENPNICLNGGTCEDLHGSYRCVCSAPPLTYAYVNVYVR